MRDEATSPAVQAYLDDEPDAGAREELLGWLANGDEQRLEEAFARPIAFGTAGLRGVVAPGPAHMNLRNVLRAVRAITEVLDVEVPDARTRGLVVGFDARPSSARFARSAASLAARLGFHVRCFSEPTATPIVAHEGLFVRAAATLVVTASHNPPADNGLKVYGPSGSQIVPPWDDLVASRMHDARPTPPDVPVDEMTAEERARVEELGTDAVRRHREDCLRIPGVTKNRRGMRVGLTALHGVGHAPAVALLGAVSVEVVPVVEQAEPDGTFPTTPDPNPEKEPALVRLRELCEREHLSIGLATDPDADRLAVLVRDDRAQLLALSGDELGVLLGWHAMRHAHGPRPFVVRTIVSSTWLSRVAEARGFEVEVTLTGHKWIHARRAEREADGATFVFGYEEALGYAFPNGVRDKDGLAAATVVASLAAVLEAEGRTLGDELEALARRYGLVRTRAAAMRPRGEATLEAVADRLRGPELGGTLVVSTIDGPGARRTWPDGRSEPLGVPSSNLFGLELEGGARVLVRPSGTEPKTKLYFELPGSVHADETYFAARRRLDLDLARLEAATLQRLG